MAFKPLCLFAQEIKLILYLDNQRCLISKHKANKINTMQKENYLTLSLTMLHVQCMCMFSFSLIFELTLSSVIDTFD